MKIQVFHNAIAPYRIDFFNAICKNLDANICLFYKRFIQSNYIDSNYVAERLTFQPEYREDFRGLRMLSFNNAVKQTIDKNDPDIIITMEYGITTLIAVLYRFIRKKKYKIVSMVDESYDMAIENRNFTWRHKLAKKLLLPFLNDIIVVNDKVQNLYQKKYGKGILFPIITDDGIAKQRQKDALLISNKYIHKYNLIGKKVVLYVGRLISIKNIDTIINSFNTDKDPDRILVVVGDGEEKNHLKKICSERKDVIFTGALHGENLYAWYNIAQIFVLPSFIEPFGAVTNEALQGGCFCLVSKAAGSSCLIEEGKNGFILPPDDPNVWSQKITKTFNQLDSIKEPVYLRESRMTLKFNNYMDNLINKISFL